MNDEQKHKIHESIANVLSRHNPVGPGPSAPVTRDQLDRAVSQMLDTRAGSQTREQQERNR